MKKLRILDRIILPSVLKQEGNYIYITLRSDILKKVNLTQEEVTKFELITQENGAVTWPLKFSSLEFDVEFSELELNEIKLALQSLDSQGKITEENKRLYEIFILNK
jgi:predicted DNA-binding transcriptional regulator YafY